jgi:hypothetical protein
VPFGQLVRRHELHDLLPCSNMQGLQLFDRVSFRQIRERGFDLVDLLASLIKRLVEFSWFKPAAGQRESTRLAQNPDR